MTPEFFYGDTLRWSFGFENPNKAAVLFACLLPLIWAGWIAAWRGNASWKVMLARLVAGILFLLAGGCLLLTFSRGGMVAALVSFAVLGVFLFVAVWSERRGIVPKRSFLAASAFLFAVLCGAAIWLGPAERSLSGIGGDASVGNRLELWSGALQMAYENPSGFGSGRSGEEFLQWYQPEGRTEGYRTMVNSYLTFLVEQGWWKFLCVTFAIGLFMSWTWPTFKAPRLLLRIALWCSLLAFLVAGIFSTTMEEPLLWLLPAGVAVSLGLLQLGDRPIRSFSRRLVAATAFSLAVWGTLFSLGAVKSRADLLGREFAPRMDGGAEVVTISWKSNPTGIRALIPDEAVLGNQWGALARRLVTRTGGTLRISRGEPIASEVKSILAAGDGVFKMENSTRVPLVLIAPGIPPEGWKIPASTTQVFLPEIDEDGRVAQWEALLASAPTVIPSTLPGVGTLIEWSWDEVIEALVANPTQPDTRDPASLPES